MYDMPSLIRGRAGGKEGGREGGGREGGREGERETETETERESERAREGGREGGREGKRERGGERERDRDRDRERETETETERERERASERGREGGRGRERHADLHGTYTRINRVIYVNVRFYTLTCAHAGSLGVYIDLTARSASYKGMLHCKAVFHCFVCSACLASLLVQNVLAVATWCYVQHLFQETDPQRWRHHFP